jgi:hypothetical protein
LLSIHKQIVKLVPRLRLRPLLPYEKPLSQSSFHPSSELFPPLLEFLSSFSELPVSVRYRSDPKEPLPRKGKGGNAGGWGVEMVLKKMEYSSVDDRVKRDQVVMEGEAEDGRSLPLLLHEINPVFAGIDADRRTHRILSHLDRRGNQPTHLFARF